MLFYIFKFAKCDVYWWDAYGNSSFGIWSCVVPDVTKDRKVPSCVWHWWWRQCELSKRRELHTQRHRVTSDKNCIFGPLLSKYGVNPLKLTGFYVDLVVLNIKICIFCPQQGFKGFALSLKWTAFVVFNGINREVFMWIRSVFLVRQDLGVC